ncbi:MAG: hypothetical protein H3C36_08740 [Chitinophagaceae bacterium]|nr:hypothetical protein [Chitinophagaceae bacterium]MCZ2397355.1 hypothetical protein [Chitinophagales bacterium]
MERFFKTLFCTLFIICGCFIAAFGQYKRIAVLGSSTSAGYFNGLFPYDSGYVPKLSKYYIEEGIIDTIYNLAGVGYDCYMAMPNGYVPPSGRPSPDEEHNITKALSKSPKPTVVLVNFPSNNYDVYSVHEIMLCLQAIRDYALAQGVQCYITTSQPRTAFSSPNRTKLKVIADSVIARFKEYAVDFFYEIVDLGNDYRILPEYSLGDGVHLNPAGHTVLKNKVVQKNIVLAPVPVYFSGINAQVRKHNVMLKWTFENPQQTVDYFKVERSNDDTNYEVIGQLASNGNRTLSYLDRELPEGNYFYRVRSIEKNGAQTVSKVVMVRIRNTNSFTGTEVFIRGHKLVLNKLPLHSEKALWKLTDLNGKTVLKGEILPGTNNFEVDISSLSPAIYIISLYNREEAFSARVIKR